MANVVKLNYTVDEINSKLKLLDNTVNMFDKSMVTENAYIHGYTGAQNSANGVFISDFILIEEGKTYSYLSNSGSLGQNASRPCVYDENKQLLGYVYRDTEPEGVGVVTVTIKGQGDTYKGGTPKYLRFNGDLAYINSTMFVEGVYPETYVGFGEFLSLSEKISNIIAKEGVSKEQLNSALESKADNVVVNLFDKSKATKDTMVHTGNGNIYSMSGFYLSDYIEVKAGKTYHYMTSVSGLGEAMAKRAVVYNSNKEYNGYITGTISGDIISITVDDTALNDIKYIRFNVGSVELDKAMCVEGDTYPSEYYDYGKRYLGEDVNFRACHFAQIPPVRSPLAGKKIAYNGDSICEGRTDITSSMYNGGAYAQIISDLTGCTFENRGKSGAVLASTTSDGASIRHICNDVENMAADADLICFEGGINDYWKAVPLGEFSESDFTGELDTTTLTGALESTFRQAINKWVGKPICFIVVHKITGTVYNENSVGYTFAEARERMIAMCEKYSIPYFDAYAESGLNPYMPIHNSTYMTNTDGCHPNEEGYRKYYVPQLISLFESLI